MVSELDEPANSQVTNEPLQPEQHSKIGTIWTTLAIFVVLLLLLAIFILQNSNKVKISYFGFHGELSLGVGLLLAAIAGSVLTLLIGSIRILQLKSHRS